MRNIITILLCLLYFLGTSQETGYYYKYEFDEFIVAKQDDKQNFIRTIQANIKYPSFERENSIEGVVKVILINHGTENPDIIAADDIHNLDEECVRIIKLAYESSIKKTSEKYITEIHLEFDIEDTEEEKRHSHIKITGFNRPGCIFYGHPDIHEKHKPKVLKVVSNKAKSHPLPYLPKTKSQ